MCGRYCLPETPECIGEVFEAVVRFSWPPRYNIAPTQRVPVVRRMIQLNGTPKREIDGMHWGLIPSWAKESSIGNRMINARAETAPEKPAFRAAWKRRRCILPASGFFEWKRVGDFKQPYLLRLADGGILGLAGLWETWRGPNGDELESVTILTTLPNSFMKKIHDRMPVILDPADWTAWLDDGEEGTAQDVLVAFVQHVPEGILEAVPVSRRVNNPRNDDAACLEEVEIA